MYTTMYNIGDHVTHSTIDSCKLAHEIEGVVFMVYRNMSMNNWCDVHILILWDKQTEAIDVFHTEILPKQADKIFRA